MKDFIIPDDRDFGTPPSKAKTMVTLTIDGFDVTVPEGTSIMRAAAEIGITVPKLCASDNLEAFGSCRLCLVEIEGRNGGQTAGLRAVGSVVRFDGFIAAYTDVKEEDAEDEDRATVDDQSGEV